MSRVVIENGRAAFAYEAVEAYINQYANDDKKKKEYRSYLKKLPAMIQVNGLGQSLAFCFANNNRPYGDIYSQIESGVRQQQEGIISRYEQNGRMKFIEIITKMDSRDYRVITNEVMALLNWMRRFADGMINV